MESLFIVAKIIRSPCKMIAYFFIQNCLKCAYDHYKGLSDHFSTVNHYSTVAFGNEWLCD